MASSLNPALKRPLRGSKTKTPPWAGNSLFRRMEMFKHLARHRGARTAFRPVSSAERASFPQVACGVSLLSLRAGIYPEFAHSGTEGGMVEAEYQCGAFGAVNSPIGLLQHLQDIVAFNFFKG